MAEIRVERKTGPKTWLWVLLVLVVLALALYLLYQGGYIGGAARFSDATEVQPASLAQSAFEVAFQQEVFHA